MTNDVATIKEMMVLVESLRADLSALRQQHAADVDAAFREGYNLGWTKRGYLDGPDEEREWLASEAKARLT